MGDTVDQYRKPQNIRQQNKFLSYIRSDVATFSQNLIPSSHSSVVNLTSLAKSCKCWTNVFKTKQSHILMLRINSDGISVIVSSLISATTGAFVLGAIIIAGQYWKI